MLRVADLIPAAVAHRSIAPMAPKASEPTAVTSWFDGDAADVRIGADLGLDSRGLSVEQHAARVLVHLCGDFDQRA
jgi:hypothetical protein